jgi:Neurotransmitter-gated ion-channel ligand binding domain
MNKLASLAVTLAVVVLCGLRIAAAQPVAEPASDPPQAAPSAAFVLGPPKDDGPVVVRASFEFHDIDEISEEKETFEFTGVLTLRWHDKRQAFDPAVVGVGEKIYQGDYQFNELAPSWFPQVVLVNSSDSIEQQGVVLRVRPDGTQTLKVKLTAVAKTEFNLRRYPFDKQRLEAVFEILGFDDSEVRLEVESQAPVSAGRLWIPQWTIIGISMSTRDHLVSAAEM